VFVMKHRNRGAPEALTRDEPVAQTVVLRGTTGSGSGELLDRTGDSVALGQAVQLARVDHAPLTGESDAGDRGMLVLHRLDRRTVLIEVDHRHGSGDGSRGVYDDLDRQVESAREVEVALVVSRHCHDRTVTVVGEHVRSEEHTSELQSREKL